MSRKTFCDMCGAEITGNDAMDACNECYTRIRQAIEECKKDGKHERD